MRSKKYHRSDLCSGATHNIFPQRLGWVNNQGRRQACITINKKVRTMVQETMYRSSAILVRDYDVWVVVSLLGKDIQLELVINFHSDYAKREAISCEKQ